MKKIITVILNLIAVSVLGGLILNFVNMLIVTFAKNPYIKQDHRPDPILNAIGVAFAFSAFLYFWYFIIFKWLLRKRHFSLTVVALLTGFINTTIYYILTNTFTMGRPSLADPLYIISLLTFFVIGFILPYSEQFIVKQLQNTIIKKFND